MTTGKQYQADRKASLRAQTPAEIVAILERGKEDREAIAAADRIQRRIADRMLAISVKPNAWDRARLVGELADWIMTVRAELDRAAEVRPATKFRRKIPSWVPAEMVPIYADEARKSGECAAAALCRKLKHGVGL